MPQIQPFKGLRYTSDAGSPEDLLAPPYDVIGPAEQSALAARNPHNAVHLELAAGGDERYQQVAQLIHEWETDGTVARDAGPMFYVYEQEFAVGAVRRRRHGLFAAVEAQPWEAGAVKPHEFTLAGPKEDRLKLLQAAKTQFSPVFLIARDRAGQLTQLIDDTIASGAPAVDATTPDGVAHRLWPIEAGPLEMRRLAPLFAESFYLADGHHRYETAVAYRDWRAGEGTTARDHPSRFTMAVIVPAGDPGLIVKPIHRVVRNAPEDWREKLEPAFEIETVKLIGSHVDQARELLAMVREDPSAIVAHGFEGWLVHVLRLRDRAAFAAQVPGSHSEEWATIAPNVLRYGVLEPVWGIGDDELRAGRVEFANDIESAMAECETQPGTVVFLLNPIRLEDVLALADKGERLPQKSTFFDPKLGTGLVFYPLE
jgi:uncharacterized protein (DUF1015 family)